MINMVYVNLLKIYSGVAFNHYLLILFKSYLIA